MIREGTLEQIKALEQVIKSMDFDIWHDGSKIKSKLFKDQSKEAPVYYKLYEVYTKPLHGDVRDLINYAFEYVESGTVKLYFDHRENKGLIEMKDRDWGILWSIRAIREAIQEISLNKGVNSELQKSK